MVILLTYGYLYICDWLTGAGGDAQDLTGKTAGQHYCYIIAPKQIRGHKRQGGDDPKYFTGNKGYGYRDGSISGQVFFQGYVSTRAELDYIDYYLISHGDAVNTIKSNPDYVFVPRASNDFDKFRDDSVAQKEYGKGWFRDYKWEWVENEQFLYSVILEFWVVWD